MGIFRKCGAEDERKSLKISLPLLSLTTLKNGSNLCDQTISTLLLQHLPSFL